MDRRALNPWIVVSAALALALLLCVSNLLLLPYTHTRKPVLPSIMTPIADWMDLGPGARSALAGLFIWPIPLAILVANLTILIIAQRLRWHPMWLAWAGLAVPVAILGSVLMAMAASLPCFTSILPWVLANAVSSSVVFGVARRKGWGPSWPWLVVLLLSWTYVGLVSLSLLLRHLGIVHHLL